MATAGYCGGDPERVRAMPVDLVVAALQYEKFKADYERKFVELNKDRRS